MAKHGACRQPLTPHRRGDQRPTRGYDGLSSALALPPPRRAPSTSGLQEHIVRTLRSDRSSMIHPTPTVRRSRGTGKPACELLACALKPRTARKRLHPQRPARPRDHDVQSLAVVEMDAASNNSVDDIRSARERRARAEGRGRASTSSTRRTCCRTRLERVPEDAREPPAHVVFVLARRRRTGACHHRRPLHASTSGPRRSRTSPHVLDRVAAEEGIAGPDPAIG